VIAWQGGNPEGMLAKLEQQGFTVLRLENAKLFDVPIQLEELSQVLTGRSTVSRGSDYLKGLEGLRKGFSSKEKVKVFYQISAEPIYTVDNKHTISEMLELCGGVNVYDSKGKTSAPVTPEAVVGMRPDVILTSAFDRDAVVEQWDGVLESENILAVNSDEVTRASLRMLQGTQNICTVVDRWRLLKVLKTEKINPPNSIPYISESRIVTETVEDEKYGGFYDISYVQDVSEASLTPNNFSVGDATLWKKWRTFLLDEELVNWEKEAVRFSMLDCMDFKVNKSAWLKNISGENGVVILESSCKTSDRFFFLEFVAFVKVDSVGIPIQTLESYGGMNYDQTDDISKSTTINSITRIPGIENQVAIIRSVLYAGEGQLIIDIETGKTIKYLSGEGWD